MVGGIDEAVEGEESLRVLMAATMKCNVVSAEQSLYEGEVQMVIASVIWVISELHRVTPR